MRGQTSKSSNCNKSATESRIVSKYDMVILDDGGIRVSLDARAKSDNLSDNCCVAIN